MCRNDPCRSGRFMFYKVVIKLCIVNTHISDDTIQFFLRKFFINLYQNFSKPHDCNITLASSVKQPGSVSSQWHPITSDCVTAHLNASLSSSMVSSLARTSSSAASPEPSGYLLPGASASLCSAGIAIDYRSGCYQGGWWQLIDFDPCITSQVLSVNSVSAYIVNMSCQGMSWDMFAYNWM